MELLKQMLPKTKKVAMLYCSAEANSKIQVAMAKKEAKKLGFETIDATVSESSEIRQVVESLKGKADAIYAPTDNLIAAGMNTVSMVANEAKIPVIVGEEGMCTGGGLATYGINYYELGKQTAAQAVKILEGKAETKTMPIEYQSNADLIINKDTVKKLGIKVPKDLEKRSQKRKNKSTVINDRYISCLLSWSERRQLFSSGELVRLLRKKMAVIFMDSFLRTSLVQSLKSWYNKFSWTVK